MTRILGPLLLVLLLLGAAGVRLFETRQARALLEGEARARTMLGVLARVSLPLSARGEAHPGLRGKFLEAAPDLVALPEPSSAEVTYARDAGYMYGLTTRSHRDSAEGPLLQGWVLRAWPLRFGVTGDAEYQLTEDGQLWEGQNRLGRSGVEHAFPPLFPDPDVGQPHTAWWSVPLPDHM